MSLTKLRWPALLAMVVLCSGCATAPKFNTTVADTGPRVGSVYVYSFLDIREKEFGPRNIAEIERQLGETLTKHGVRNKQLWFNRAPVRDRVALNQVKKGNWFINLGNSTVVPVAEVVQSNYDDEKTFGAQFRMLIFPADTIETGTGMIFELRWLLLEAASEKVVWSATSRTDNMNMWKKDEQPEKRAFMLVDGLVKELLRVGIFK